MIEFLFQCDFLTQEVFCCEEWPPPFPFLDLRPPTNLQMVLALHSSKDFLEPLHCGQRNRARFSS